MYVKALCYSFKNKNTFSFKTCRKKRLGSKREVKNSQNKNNVKAKGEKRIYKSRRITKKLVIERVRKKVNQRMERDDRFEQDETNKALTIILQTDIQAKRKPLGADERKYNKNDKDISIASLTLQGRFRGGFIQGQIPKVFVHPVKE